MIILGVVLSIISLNEMRQRDNNNNNGNSVSSSSKLLKLSVGSNQRHLLLNTTNNGFLKFTCHLYQQKKLHKITFFMASFFELFTLQ